MFDVFRPLRALLKTDDICIDNVVFRLHYKVTVLILLACSSLITGRQFFGDPIDCIVDGIPPNIMDSYCWIYSTFTIPKLVDGKVGKNIAHPGVANFVENADTVKYHNYYQWVCFVLFFQAMFFYIPRYMWKLWEAGRMRALVFDLNCPINYDVEHRKLLTTYFVNNLHMQNFYAIRFFLCEIFNLCNVFLQIYFMDVFLEGEFRSYGYDVLRITEKLPEERTDIMARVFPKVTKCTFNKYGPTGTIQKFDGMCVLPLNILNEKIYVFLWFWFWFIAIISVLNFVYRMVIILVPFFRLFMLRSRADRFSYDKLQTLTEKFWIGDWFVLYQLAKNISPVVFREFISDMTKKFEEKNNV